MAESGYRNNPSDNPYNPNPNNPYRRNRSNSSGCFLERLDLETPTPPPSMPMMNPTSGSHLGSVGGTLGGVSKTSYYREKPKYKYNGFMPKHGSAATDYTSAGSPPGTPVPTPPPPPPLTSSKSMKHFEYKPAHVL